METKKKNEYIFSKSLQQNPFVFQPPSGIRPQMFKTLVGKGHPEFSTKRQQDAQEFFLHIINILEVHLFGNKMWSKLYVVKICQDSLSYY